MIEGLLLCIPFHPGVPVGAEIVVEELPGGLVAEFEVEYTAEGVPRREGSFTVLGPDGTKRVLGEYSAGKRSGRWRFRYADGSPLAAGSFRQGSRSGEWEFEYPDGEPWMKGDYRGGWPRGEWKVWRRSGELDLWHSGDYDYVRIDLEGGGEARGPILDGQPHGPWTTTWRPEQVQLEAEFGRGERSGSWRFWHVDGSFDPAFLSGEYAGPRWEPLLRVDPVEIEPASPGLSAEARERLRALGYLGSTEMALDTRVISLIAHPKLVAADLRRTYDDARGGDATATLRLLGHAAGGHREVLPLILDELADLDFDRAEDQGRCRWLLSELVGPIAWGLRLVRPDEGDPDVLRLAVLRLASLEYLTRGADLWWQLDLAFGPGAGLEVPAPALLRPAVPIEGFARLTAEDWLYASRFARRDPIDRKHRKALDAALEWLVLHQDPEGKWDCDDFMKHDVASEVHDGPGMAEHDVACTALSLLALMGDGSTPTEGPYRENVLRGVRWLLSQQDRESGLLTEAIGSAFLYDHAIATWALCEAYAFSGSQAVATAAQGAVDCALRARNPKGVWRYELLPDGNNDTSVTGWMAYALAAAEEAGLRVDPIWRRYTRDWLEQVTDPATGRVGYDVRGSKSARVHGVNEHFPVDASEAMTGIGLQCRLILGQDAEEPILEKHVELLLKCLPAWEPASFRVDQYYWFQATEGLRHVGGKAFDAWTKALEEALLESQHEDGCWPPVGPWGHAGGRVYSTALSALMLESPKRHARVPGRR